MTLSILITVTVLRVNALVHGWETAGCSGHAGQSDWPEKNCLVLLPKKRRRPVLFPHEAIFPMDSPLSQHKKRSFTEWHTLFSVCPRKLFCDPYTNLLPTLLKLGSQSKSTTLCRKRPASKCQWIQRLTSYNGALIRHCGWLTCMEITIFIAEVTTVYHGPLDCVSWLLCLSRRYKVFKANILMLYLYCSLCRFALCLPFHINCIEDLSL